MPQFFSIYLHVSFLKCREMSYGRYTELRYYATIKPMTLFFLDTE